MEKEKRQRIYLYVSPEVLRRADQLVEDLRERVAKQHEGFHPTTVSRAGVLRAAVERGLANLEERGRGNDD